MVDRKREGRYNQKREVRILAIPFVAAQLATDGGAIFATLPQNVLVSSVDLIVKTRSTTANATVQPVINGVNYGTGMAITTVGIVEGDTKLHLASGGTVALVPGSTPATDSALVGELVISYVELDMTNGEYTN